MICLSIIGGVLCIGVLMMIFKPVSAKWNEQSVTINNNERMLKQYKQLIRSDDDLEDHFNVLSQQLQSEIPQEREESQFLTEIGKVAQLTNVHISSINPRPFKDLDKFKELSVEIEMEANLGNLVRFLYYMRKSSVVLVANQLRLEPKAERSALLRGHLVISTIFLKDE